MQNEFKKYATLENWSEIFDIIHTFERLLNFRIKMSNFHEEPPTAEDPKVCFWSFNGSDINRYFFFF